LGHPVRIVIYNYYLTDDVYNADSTFICTETIKAQI